jgi:pilus assembly protein CpaF
LNLQLIPQILGPLANLYFDPQVMDILVDAPDRVLVDRSGQLEDSGPGFASPEEFRTVIEDLLALAEVQPDPGQTVVDTRLPDGTRMVVVLPPSAIQGACLTLRKLRKPYLDWKKLVDLGSITEEALNLLKSALVAHRSLLVAGNANSGKTTLLNLIAESLPPEERLVVIQTDFGLQIRHPRAVLLGASEASSTPIEGLIRAASKMRPDWLVVGELSGPEAMAALEVLNRGHAGILNIHAESAEDALTRLETFCLMANLGLGLNEIRAIIASALKLINFQQYMPDHHRRVVQIVELLGLKDGRYQLQPLFRFNHSAMRLESSGVKPSWA